MSLLFWLCLPVTEDLVDNAQPRPQFRTLYSFPTLVARRQRILQHLPDSLPRQAKLARRLPDAHAVHLHGSSYACIHFHLVHLLVSHKHNYPVLFWTESVVVYFWTATNRRSRGASWSIIAPPFIGGTMFGMHVKPDEVQS